MIVRHSAGNGRRRIATRRRRLSQANMAAGAGLAQFRSCAFRESTRRPIRWPTVVVIQTCFVRAIDGGFRVPLGAILDLLSREIHEDLSLLPTDAAGPVWRNQHALAQPPVAGVDYQIADFPCLIVDDAISDVADGFVASLDVVPTDLFVTSQVTVPGRLLGTLGRPFVPLAGRQTTRIGTHAPKSGVLPIVGVSII